MCHSHKHVKEIMQNDSDTPVSEEEQTYVGCITAKRESIIEKRKHTKWTQRQKNGLSYLKWMAQKQDLKLTQVVK